MLAVDTSSLVAYFHGENGEDVEAVNVAFDEHCAVFPVMVLCEMLSDHKLSNEVVWILKNIPKLDVSIGFWERAGLLRAKVLAKGYKARLADALVAQICIDHKVPLITRDKDFRHFKKYGGLSLAC